MKSKNAKNNSSLNKRNINTRRWETTHQIKKSSDNTYNVNRKIENNKSKIISAIFIIVITLIVLTTLYYFFKDHELMDSILKVADSYIFIGITTFIIFLVFNNNKKEYNKNKKGVK